ncbi:hypothetical protein PybrP1_003443 [[Pythium] brassicae (nom. inval.)]|nr:hypothetical protein PybrP1_003443 [[Pythium] brassicae (nom. inval.)]
MVKATFAIGMALGAMAAADATKINFINQCGYNVDLQHVQGGSQIARLSNIAPGTAYAYYANGPAHMFRHGYGDQATLAEFSIPGDGKAWYDISIIPPGPGQCRSYEDCKGATGRKGFNVPMNIAPKQNANGRNCRQLVCPADDKWACADAYHFPADTKTHDCPDWTEFDVVFCPGGPGGNGGGGVK